MEPVDPPGDERSTANGRSPSLRTVFDGFVRPEPTPTLDTSTNGQTAEREPHRQGQVLGAGAKPVLIIVFGLFLLGWFACEFSSGFIIFRRETATPSIPTPQELEATEATAAFMAAGPPVYVAEGGWLETAGLNDAVSTDTGVEATDLVVEAIFIPPIQSPRAGCDPSIAHCWDFGFVLRDSEVGRYIVAVASSGEWDVSFIDGGSGKVTRAGGGRTGLVLRDAELSNQLRFAALGNQGHVFLNSRYLGTVNLSAHTLSGKVNAGVSLLGRPGPSTGGWNMAYKWLRIWIPSESH